MKLIKHLLFFVIILSCQEKHEHLSMIRKDVQVLSHDSLMGRETGTEGERIAAEYIKKRFVDLNISPVDENGYFQKFTFNKTKNPHQNTSFTNQLNDSSVTGTNVIGYIDNLSENTIVIGAHYDHLGYGGTNSLYRDKKNQIHNGADDNASGTALVLDLASKLKTSNRENNYLFIAFSGEEIGILGSNFFTKNSPIPTEKYNYMINMDMVGRLDADSTLAVFGVGTSPLFKQVLNSSNSSFKLTLKDSGIGPSDHTSFYTNDIPVLHFFTGQHKDYHKPSDDYEKINFPGMEKISSFIYDIISQLNNQGKLKFKKTVNESEQAPKFNVTLGVIPDYLFDGIGMKIDGVSENRPAQKAGMAKGDVVIKMGDHQVNNMMDYMTALSKFEKGQEAIVLIERDKTKIEKKVIF
tara:strand:+ start:18 stop:1244 length:1227 start_codon:yes stop_codon:yes gene_type:complete